MARWHQMDPEEFVEQCMDSTARRELIQREVFNRNISALSSLAGLIGVLVFMHDPWASALAVVFLAISLFTLSVSVSTLRRASLIDKLVPGPSVS